MKEAAALPRRWGRLLRPRRERRRRAAAEQRNEATPSHAGHGSFPLRSRSAVTELATEWRVSPPDRSESGRLAVRDNGALSGINRRQLSRRTSLLPSVQQACVQLLDHVVGGHLQPKRNRNAQRLGGFQIDHEIEFGGL